MTEGIAVFDLKIVTGLLFTGVTASITWVETANSYGQLMLTAVGIAVGLTTLWFTVERARCLRRARKERKGGSD